MPSNDRYERTLEELEKHGCRWWPKEVRDKAAEISVLHTLIETQDKFISILKLLNRNEPERITPLLKASGIPYNLFLKHMLVLADFGGEPLQRVNADFINIFPEGTLTFDSGQEEKTYRFKKLPINGKLDNKKMKTSTVEDFETASYDADLCEDIVMLVSYGSTAARASVRAILYKCVLSEYFGQSKKIDKFVKENYIRVSRIIAGKTATDLGNTAQQYACDYLRNKLGEDYVVRSNGTVPGVTENDGDTLMPFDIVVDRVSDESRHKRYVGIEVAFQETTNSVVERKRGQARSRFEKMSASRNYVAYIIDGVGMFARDSASRTLCENSHCTVAYTAEEFDLLCEFIMEKIGE